MKNFLSNAISACKKFEIFKSYDCKTEMRCGDSETPRLSMHLKGDYTLKPIHIAVGAGILTAACIASAIKRKCCCKK